MGKRVGFSQLEGEILTNIERCGNSTLYFTTESGKIFKLSDDENCFGKFDIDTITDTADIFGKPIVRADLFLNKKNSPTYKIRVQDDIVIITWKRRVDGFSKGEIIFEEVVNSSIGPILEGLKEGDIVDSGYFKNELYKICYSDKPFVACEYFYGGDLDLLKHHSFISGFYAVEFTNFTINGEPYESWKNPENKYIIARNWVSKVIKDGEYINIRDRKYFTLISSTMSRRRKGRKRKTQQCPDGVSPRKYVIPELVGGF